MVRPNRYHVVVRWGASVLVAKNVEARGSTLRAAFSSALCADLAAAIDTDESGIVRIDGDPLLADTEVARSFGPYVVEASPAIACPTKERRRKSRLAVAGVLASLFAHAAFVGGVIAFRATLAPTEEEENAARLAERTAIFAAIDVQGAPGAPTVSPVVDAPETPVPDAAIDEWTVGENVPTHNLTASFGGGADVGSSMDGIGGRSHRAHPLRVRDLSPVPSAAPRDPLDALAESAGHVTMSHLTRTFPLRYSSDGSSGRLPPEVIQRIVRQNFGRFRLCYEKALVGNPNLSGRVTVRFVIARDGSVATSNVRDSNLPEAASACIAQAFALLSFPEPEGGTVNVVYPLVLSPE